jgi:hypothetical protein
MYNDNIQGDGADQTGGGGGYDPTPRQIPLNWWEGPRPQGYYGTWPPTLPPGAHYGPNLGQIIFAPDTPGGVNDPQKPDTTPHPGDFAPPKPAAPATPPPGGNNRGAGGTLGHLLDPFVAPTERYGFPDLPVFTAPIFHPPPAFVDPTAAEVEAEPGYAFAKAEGLHALENTRAAQGLGNTGGTLKDYIAWGGNYASQRYADTRNRQKDTYLTNYTTQYMDPFEKAYRSALDEFAPKMTGFNAEVGWNQRANETDWQHAWDVFRDQRDSTFNKTYTVANT